LPNEISQRPTSEERSRFTNVAVAGITFQAGSAAVDSSTIMAALVHQLTGSSLAVGAVTTILRVGWLFPQLFVGYFAQQRGSSMRYYVIGGFGRAACITVLAIILIASSNIGAQVLSAAVLLAWTAYAFVSGIVAVPYNDIVARAVPSERRSRLLATRFFGGGVLALGVVAIADTLIESLAFPASYAAIFGIASLLMFVSSTVFVVMGEPAGPSTRPKQEAFLDYLREGIVVFRTDRRFRLFVFSQWFGGAALTALPFYVVQANALGLDLKEVVLLVGAQTAGALVSNLLWGWWGDKLGKGSLLQAIAFGRMLPPALMLLMIFVWEPPTDELLVSFIGIFFILGALANGLTIGVVGYLMEISPEESRPSYSGYFNALTAPAFLFPLIGGALVTFTGFAVVFSVSLIAASMQFLLILCVK
jgi:MFS family permease